MRFRSTALLVGLAIGFGPSVGSAKTLDCQELPALFRSYTIHHYSVRKVEPEIRNRTAELFVQATDPSRTLLLQEDVDRFERELPKVFTGAFRGRCGVIEDAVKLAVDRSEQSLEWVRKQLGPDYALDESVELILDPKERGWPADEGARRRLVSRQVHFQIASYLAGGLDLQKAKKQLVHRYELNVKRLRERQERKQGPELFAGAFALALDPHSSYLSQDDLADFRIQMQLSLEGIGAALRSEDGFTYIESVIPGGAADRADVLQPKDKIMAVAQDGETPVSTIDMDIRDVVKLIRGPKGTPVTLTILREGKKTRTFDVTIIRDKIDVKQQAAKIDYETRTVGDKKLKIGVLELPSFYGGGNGDGRSSYQDVLDLVEEAKKQKVDGLVLDLSRNGGGLLQDAVRISGLFLRTGGIVATKDTRGELEILEDEDPEVQYSGPLAVVVSPISASGAEILAGALQAYGRAVIVGGPQTFGKGTVQAVLPLPSQLGAMKITTGMFFLPNGQSTQLEGVKADVVVPSLMNSFDVGEKDLDFALPPGRIDDFVSERGQGEGEDRWAEFDPKSVESLEKRSVRRVKKSEAFQDIQERISDAPQNGETMKLSELRKTASGSKEGDGGDDEAPASGREEAEALHEAFTDEAVDVLVDWMKARGVETAAR